MASMFLKPCEFVAGAASLDSLPGVSRPEIAFAGRSNVGKSSLINALTSRTTLARTSQNPGATKQLNFFLLDQRLMLVDMPGYGYAKVAKSQKGQWDNLIRHYLAGRPTLKRALLLIDARRGILPPDTAHMALLDEAAVSFQIVLTKIDQLTESAQGALLRDIEKTLTKHPAAHPVIRATSAAKKLGIEELREELETLA